jgi:drug/metabolite transporter (DMT)-like permease
MGSRRKAVLAWLVVCLVWGTTYLGIRIALETMPPFLLASLRWLLAGSLLAALLVVRRERFPGPGAWRSLATLGVLMMAVGNGGVVWAQQTVPSGLTSVLVAGVPFWMVAVERLMPGGEPLTLRRLLGLIVGFGGIVLLVWPQVHLPSGSGILGGVASVQLAGLGWAIGSAYARRRRMDENVLAAAAVQMLFAGAALLVVSLARGEPTRASLTGRTAGALAYLVVAGSVVGYTAYAYALKHLPIATVSLYAYVNPIIAVALGTIVAGEEFSPRIVLAGVIVFAGVGMVRDS